MKAVSAADQDKERKAGVPSFLPPLANPASMASQEKQPRDFARNESIDDRTFHAQRLEGIGMLAAGIAHDLNNILTPVLMVVPMVEERVTDPEALKHLHMISESVKRGAGLLRQILSIAHRSDGEAQSHRVKHVIHDLSIVIQETFPKSITYEESVPRDIWAIEGDPIQIHQVLLNLCINARDAMRGGGTLRVGAENCVLDADLARTIPGSRAGEFVLLQVKDTGAGIAAEILPRIWEPFYTTKGPDGGTGLGLPTVRAIVELHRGFISLDSVPGRGSTFRIWLPATADGPMEESSPLPRRSPRGNGELILVVEDEASIRKLADIALTKQGYRVLAAGDGAEASTLFSRNYNEITLVITDLNMPNLDGRALIEFVRQINPAIKILAISGRREPAGIGTDVEKNPVVFLAKPFQLEQLLSEVNRLLPNENGDH